MVRTSTDSQLNGGFDGAARFLLDWWISVAPVPAPVVASLDAIP